MVNKHDLSTQNIYLYNKVTCNNFLFSNFDLNII